MKPKIEQFSNDEEFMKYMFEYDCGANDAVRNNSLQLNGDDFWYLQGYRSVKVLHCWNGGVKQTCDCPDCGRTLI